MEFTLMQEVIIQSDAFSLQLPIGKTGVIAKIDRAVDQAQPYCIRVPWNHEWYWVPECDIADAAEWTSKSAEEVVRESLINGALDRKNKQAFIKAIKNTGAEHGLNE